MSVIVRVWRWLCPVVEEDDDWAARYEPAERRLQGEIVRARRQTELARRMLADQRIPAHR